LNPPEYFASMGKQKIRRCLRALLINIQKPIQPRTDTENGGQNPKRKNLLQHTEGAENTDKIGH